MRAGPYTPGEASCVPLFAPSGMAATVYVAHVMGMPEDRWKPADP